MVGRRRGLLAFREQCWSGEGLLGVVDRQMSDCRVEGVRDRG